MTELNKDKKKYSPMMLLSHGHCFMFKKLKHNTNAELHNQWKC